MSTCVFMWNISQKVRCDVLCGVAMIGWSYQHESMRLCCCVWKKVIIFDYFYVYHLTKCFWRKSTFKLDHVEVKSQFHCVFDNKKQCSHKIIKMFLTFSSKMNNNNSKQSQTNMSKLKIHQWISIVRYLGRHHGLCAKFQF